MHHIPISKLSDQQRSDLELHGICAVGDMLYQPWSTDRTGQQWLRSIEASRRMEREIRAVQPEAEAEVTVYTAIDSYDDLLKAIIAGDNFDDEAGLAILSAERKTLADLDADLIEAQDAEWQTLLNNHRYAEFLDDGDFDDE